MKPILRFMLKCSWGIAAGLLLYGLTFYVFWQMHWGAATPRGFFAESIIITDTKLDEALSAIYSPVLKLGFFDSRIVEKVNVAPAAPRTSTDSLASAPPRTEADAGVLVTNFICKMGIKLEHYEQPSITYDSERREWWFFYTLKPPGMPGGHFTVVIDETGKIQFIGGA